MRLWRVLYEIFIILIVLTYGILIFADPAEHPELSEALLKRADLVLISFFTLEFGIRLALAERKLAFLRRNWFDVVALLPLDMYFPLARLMRIARMIRIMRSSPLIWSVMSSRPMRLIFLFLVILMVWSATGFYMLEHGKNPLIQTFGDALWWAIVTTTTVGYGDISPVTESGRIIAVVLMVSGIALIGTFTANLANHWMEYFHPDRPNWRGRGQLRRPLEPYDMPDDEFLQNRLKLSAYYALQNIETLSDAEYKRLLKTLELLRAGSGKKDA